MHRNAVALSHLVTLTRDQNQIHVHPGSPGAPPHAVHSAFKYCAIKLTDHRHLLRLTLLTSDT